MKFKHFKVKNARKGIVSLVFVLFCSILTYGQNKGDNTVIVKDTTVKLDIIRKAWILDGFAIDKNTNDYLTTEIKQKGWYGMKFSALQDADSIILKGWVRADITLSGLRSKDLIVADFKGMKGSANRETFIYLLETARKLTNFVETTKK